MNTRYRFLILLLPPVTALLLYLPALHGGLVWDDPLFLYHPLYRQPVNWGRVLGSPFVLSPNYFRPLAVATFVLFFPTFSEFAKAQLHPKVGRHHCFCHFAQPESCLLQRKTWFLVEHMFNLALSNYSAAPAGFVIRRVQRARIWVGYGVPTVLGYRALPYLDDLGLDCKSKPSRVSSYA